MKKPHTRKTGNTEQLENLLRSHRKLWMAITAIIIFAVLRLHKRMSWSGSVMNSIFTFVPESVVAAWWMLLQVGEAHLPMKHQEIHLF